MTAITGAMVLGLCFLNPTGPEEQLLPDTPACLQDASPAWVESMRKSIGADAAILIIAYDLDQQAIDQLREEIYGIWCEDFFYEQAQLEELKILQQIAEDKDPSLVEETPELIAYSEAFRGFYVNLPTNPENLAIALESLLPPQDFTEARKRLEELRHRQAQRMFLLPDDSTRRATAGRHNKRARAARMAGLTASGRPIPTRRWLDYTTRESALADAASRRQFEQERLERAKARRRPAAGAVRRSARSERPSAGEQTTPLGEGDSPMDFWADPAWTRDLWLNAWAQYVAEAVERHAPAARRREKARALLVEFRERLEAYRASRIMEYGQTEEGQDARAYQQRLAELDAPLAALFEELKLRVEKL